ncbi:MAG: NAD-dependent succinate-semialdehyde dehydrogenase [Chitinophagales bacterium]
MLYRTWNPYTNELLKSFDEMPLPDLTISEAAFRYWKKMPIIERAAAMRKLADVIEKNKSQYAQLITTEMGKPIAEAEYEIAKVLTAFEYYIENAPAFLQNEMVKSNASHSYISFEPLGIILSVMPWNFPFWQVFRFAVPALMAGNVTILKHAPSVPQCALAIEAAFREAGLPDGLLRTIFLSNQNTEQLIADSRIRGVSFTGSDATGSIIAGLAGKHIKRAVVELGGNDPFIVLEDADLELTVAGAVKSRSINSGQSCNAAKRFFVVENIYESFNRKLIAAVQQLQIGDPMERTTQIGPLARPDLADKVRDQIKRTIEAGSKAFQHPSDQVGPNVVRPTVLTDVKPGMCAFEEEIFGPVWSVIKVRSLPEAVELANLSVYGLGASIWTADVNAVMPFVSELESGNVFVNDIVKSDARLPFGGVKRSGFGRELSEFGIREFVNIKTVYIH